MTTFVTGATGHLGGNLVRALIDRGERVRVLVRNESDLRPIEDLDLERVHGDLRDRSGLSGCMRGCNRVYHLAALVSLRNRDVQQIYEVNVQGTRNVCEAALEVGVERMVHCSSFGAIGNNPHGASDESWTIRPWEDALEYERSKAFSEHEVLRAVASGLDAVIVNPSGIVGPWDYRPSFLGKTILDFGRGRMRAFVPGAFDFVHVRDVVDGHLLAMEKGRTGQRYLLSGEHLTLDEILDWLSDLTGKSKPSLRLPPKIIQHVAGIKDWFETTMFPHAVPRFTKQSIRLLNSGKHGDNTKARRELGLCPTPVQDAFGQAVEWFRQHGFM